MKTSSKPIYQFAILEDNCIPKENVSATNIWTGFKERTSAHGVPHVHQAKGLFKYWFWMVISLGCFGTLIFHTYYISDLYFQYRVDVLVKLKHNREMTFPAVTICNMSPIRSSKVNPASELEMLFKEQQDLSMTMSGIRDDFTTELRAMELISEMSSTEKSSMGYQIDELLLDCQYDGYNCFGSDMAHFFDPLHGNCYIFNSQWISPQTTAEVSRRPGRRHGLKMVMNIDQGDYVNALAQGAGVRIVVHPQNRMPFPQDEGILASPGKMTSIGIRQILIDRMDQNYGNCTRASSKNVTRNVYEELYPATEYSSTACFKTCYQKHLVEQCNCADPQLPTQGSAFGNKSNSPCRSQDPIQSDCMATMTQKYQRDELECYCPQLCREYSFNFEVSSVVWPSNINMRNLVDKFKPSMPNMPIGNESQYVTDNVLKVEMYFQEFNSEVISERPAYLEANFASDFGGVLGLWVGCSILSIFEFVELAMDYVVWIYFTCKKKCKPASGKENTTEAPPVDNGSDNAVPATSSSVNLVHNNISEQCINDQPQHKVLNITPGHKIKDDDWPGHLESRGFDLSSRNRDRHKMPSTAALFGKEYTEDKLEIARNMDLIPRAHRNFPEQRPSTAENI